MDKTVPQALEAAELLGEPADKMPQGEADLRTFIHDLLHAHHDKDYRTPAAFPLEDLRKLCLCFVRVDSTYQASQDKIVGDKFDGDPRNCLHFHAQRGHLTLLVPRKPLLPFDFARSIPAVGWREHLDSDEDQGPLVTLPQCKICSYKPGHSACRTGYEPHAFGTTWVERRIGGVEAGPNTPWTGDNASALELLADLSGADLSESNEKQVLHLVCDSSPSWDPQVASIGLSLYLAPQSPVPAQLATKALPVLHLPRAQAVVIVLPEGTPCPWGPMSHAPEPQQKWTENVGISPALAIARTFAEENKPVLLTAPCTSAAWVSKDILEFLSAHPHDRLRAPPPERPLRPESRATRWNLVYPSTGQTKLKKTRGFLREN